MAMYGKRATGTNGTNAGRPWYRAFKGVRQQSQQTDQRERDETDFQFRHGNSQTDTHERRVFPFSLHSITVMSATQKLHQHPVFIQASNKANYYISQLDKELSKYPVLNALEQRTQIPKSYAVIACVFLAILLHFVNPLAAPVSNFVGWAFPAYLSFKALETPQPQDDVQWLTYWVVFGFFNFLESLALRLVLYYVPWYFTFKTIFVIWLQLPVFRGAQMMYLSILKPVLVNISHSQVVATTSSHTDSTSGNLREPAGMST